jgi:hypothetical protein
MEQTAISSIDSYNNPPNNLTPFTPIDDIPVDTSKFSKGIDPMEVADLKAKGYSVTQISKYLNISRQNVWYHLKKVGKIYPTAGKFFCNKKADVFEGLQEKIVNSIDNSKLKAMSAGTGITGLAILEDKIRLIRGQSTVNHGVSGQVLHLIGSPADFKQVLDSISVNRKAKVFESSPTGSRTSKQDNDTNRPTDKA